MAMDIADFADFLATAIENERKEQFRQQWTAMLPFMAMGMLKFMPFDDYYESCTGATIDMRSAKDIINEICEMHGLEVSTFGDI